MSEKYLGFMDSIIGPLGIIESDGYITHIFFKDREKFSEFHREKDQPKGEKNRKKEGEHGEKIIRAETDLIKETKGQLEEYFKGERRDFNLPLKTTGTDFQKAAWQALIDIPYGEVRSYKQQAEKVGSPKAYRAVGMANNKNPIAIVIPCHRVIGADGKLVGYGGGLDIKQTLLDLERKVLEKKNK